MHTYFVIARLDHYAAIFRALAETSRMRVLALLLAAGKDLCVCELVDSLEEPQYRVSKSLRALLKLELVSERRDGKWTYYRVAKADDAWLEAIHKAVMAIPREILSRDQAELARRFRLRVGGKCLLGVQKRELLSRPEKPAARPKSVASISKSTPRTRKR